MIDILLLIAKRSAIIRLFCFFHEKGGEGDVVLSLRLILLLLRGQRGKFR